MPARTCSATRAEVKKPRHSAAVTNSLAGMSCLTHRPQSGGSNSGTTKNQRNICTSSGMLRNSSTQAAPSAASPRCGAVRSVPTAMPINSASSQAVSDTASVQPSPVASQSR
jgi:hypothetical protein